MQTPANKAWARHKRGADTKVSGLVWSCPLLSGTRATRHNFSSYFSCVNYPGAPPSLLARLTHRTAAAATLLSSTTSPKPDFAQAQSWLGSGMPRVPI